MPVRSKSGTLTGKSTLGKINAAKRYQASRHVVNSNPPAAFYKSVEIIECVKLLGSGPLQ